MDGQEFTKLSINTKTVVGNLPNEILLKVFTKLWRAALKNVRLTSKRWSELSAGLMFERIYSSPAKTVIENFTLITSNPLLCTNITEVVYDARIFSLDDVLTQDMEKKRETVLDVYHGCQEDDYDPLSGSQLQQATENLHRLYEEQQDILDNARDTKAFIAGLRNLPRLEDLTIPARLPFRDVAYVGAVEEYQHLGYVLKLDKLIDIAVLPKEDISRANYFHLFGPGDLWQKTQWSSQGINHLFEVCGLGQRCVCHCGN